MFNRRNRCTPDRRAEYGPEQYWQVTYPRDVGPRRGPGPWDHDREFDFHPSSFGDPRERGFGGAGFRSPWEHVFSGRAFGGLRHGGFGGPRHGGGFSPGRGERLFDGGDLKLVILKLIAEKPSYGYELIKRMEERLAGGYAPSPGVIYPTLTLLEEEGLTTSRTSDAGKKVYTVTEAGQAELTSNQQRLDAIFDRLEHAGRGFRRGRSPELMRAFMSLRSAVAAKMSREGLTPEQIQKISDAIEAAARAIDAV